MRDPDETRLAGVVTGERTNTAAGPADVEAARRLFELLGVALQGGKLRVVVTSGAAERTGGGTEFLVRFEDGENGREGFSDLARLSACEREVARWVAQGFSNDEVARRLGKSVLTVKKQLRAVYQKLGVPTRARLCALLR